jgi:hypothetical protein
MISIYTYIQSNIYIYYDSSDSSSRPSSFDFDSLVAFQQMIEKLGGFPSAFPKKITSPRRLLLQGRWGPITSHNKEAIALVFRRNQEFLAVSEPEAPKKVGNSGAQSGEVAVF